MELEDVVLRAWRPVWQQRKLWILGLFVSAAGGAGPVNVHGRHGQGGGLPAWLPWVVAGASVLGIVLFFLHVLSEAALIDLVARPRAEVRIRESLGAARRFFGRIAALKLLTGLAFVLGVGLLVGPVLAGVFHLVPLPLGIAVTVLLALVAIPAGLTLYFLYQYALRIAVLEDVTARESLRKAHGYLHGKIARSLVLLVIAGAAGPAAGLAGLVCIVPAALVGGLTYLAAGLVPAIVAFAILALPVAFATSGLVGSFQSSLWTTAFLDAREGAT